VVSGDPHDWPAYARSADGARWNFAENRLRASSVARLNVLWEFPTGGSVSGTPVVLNNVVYAGDTNGVIYALNHDGSLRWMNDTLSIPAIVGVKLTASMLVTNRAVIFGDTAGQIHALDIDTGELCWTTRPGCGPLFPEGHPFQAIFSAGTMVGRYVAFGVSSWEWAAPLFDPNYPGYTFRGSVVLIDPANGRIVWQSFLVPETEPQPDGGFGPSGASVWGSPAYDRPSNTIFVGTSNNYGPPATQTSDALIAINATDGSFRWVRQMTPDDTWNMSHFPPEPGSPPDSDFGDSVQLYRLRGRLVVAAGQKNGVFHVVDAATGESIETPTQFLEGGILGGFHMDSASANGVNYAPGNHAWANPFAPPPDGGAVVAISSDGSEELWRVDLPAAILAGVAVAADVVYAQSMDGQFYAIDARSGAVLRQLYTGGDSSGPSISRGRVYVGTGQVVAPLFTFGVPGSGSIIALGLTD
jgi:polyvinyl alcohol dehydrogenase (cytochrome)